MPFDANLVLCDTTADWTHASLATNGTPTSTATRNAGGFVVIDLLALSGTAAQGMAVIFICDQAAEATDDALTMILQGSDAANFTYSGTAGALVDVHTLATFEVGGAGAGIIVGNEVPCTIIRRFATTKRYIRIKASLAASDEDFHTCQVFLAPWPFHVL